MTVNVSAEKALIFRITHINNMRWILCNGLHCRNSDTCDPNFVQIGDPELITKRATRQVPIPPYGALSDYISFYFTPFSIMMYNIKTGYRGIRQFPNSEIVIMVSSLRNLADHNVTAVYSDRHAYLSTTQFYSSLDDLENIDWGLLRRKDFRRDLDDPEKTDRYQAEVLIHEFLPVERLLGIVCYGESEETALQELMQEANRGIKVTAQRNLYF